MSNGILQSGAITPNHLCSWISDGVIGDSGATLINTQAIFRSTITAVNFNLINSDNQILVNLPAGYTRWRCNRVQITNPSGALNTATCGLFTGTAASGVQIVTSGSAITITTNSMDTNNNAQALTINNGGTLIYSDTAVYFRLQVGQGVAATADVTVEYEVFP